METYENSGNQQAASNRVHGERGIGGHAPHGGQTPQAVFETSGRRERSATGKAGIALVIGISLLMGLAGGAVGGFAMSFITGAANAGTQAQAGQMGAPGQQGAGEGIASDQPASNGTGDSADAGTEGSTGTGDAAPNGTQAEPPTAPGNSGNGSAAGNSTGSGNSSTSASDGIGGDTASA